MLELNGSMAGAAAATGLPQWDEEVDLVVIGAGAAGMTAALIAACEGLQVLLCERTAQVGGTTATSGGAAWIPGNTQGRATARPDTVEAARTYLRGEIGDVDLARREAFFASAADAIDYLERRTEVRFRANDPYPDYHAERPGGALGGRTLAPLPFDGRRLGADFALIRPPVPEFTVLGGMMVGRDEIRHLIRPWSSRRSMALTARLLWNQARDRLRLPRGSRLLLGNALVARLLHSCRAQGVDLRLRTRLDELVSHDGRIGGARLRGPAGVWRVRARRGVVLATGGCAADPAWRRRLHGGDVPSTLAFETNDGSGLDAALAAGAALDTDHAQPFFWMPASTMHWRDGRDATFPHIRDRPKPGLIAVDAQGQRFVNEANSYHDFVAAMFAVTRHQADVPVHLVCDRRFIREYGLGVVHPMWQRLGYFRRAGYLQSASSLDGLARRIGVDPDALQACVEAHNRDAVHGVDPLFGKGSKPLNRFNGDPANGPNPCLRPIERGPFYALPVLPAPIGSSVGLATSVDGEVLGATGAPLPGLYACGNDMSSIMRGHYPGPGITLGPALAFAYRLVMRATGRPRPPAQGPV